MFKNKTVIFIALLIVVLIAIKLIFLSDKPQAAQGGGPVPGRGNKQTVVNGIVVSKTDLEEGVLQ